MKKIKKNKKIYLRELGFFFYNTIQFPVHHMQEKVETLP